MKNNYLGKKCPYCNITFKEDDAVVFCKVCDMPHHLSCWKENGGCTTFGCMGEMSEILKDEDAYSDDVIVKERKTASFGKLETIYEDKDAIFQMDVPILIENRYLIKDTISGELYARISFKSLTDRSIKALLIDIKGYDIWGNEVGGVEGFQLLDIKTKRESNFGQTTPIPIPDKSVKAIKAVIRKVLYSDGEILICNETGITFPKAKLLSESLGSAVLADEYVRETAELSKYEVAVVEGAWRCACGSINVGTECLCYKCGQDKDRLVRLLDVSALKKNVEAFQEEMRLKAEEEERARAEREREEEEARRKAQEEKERQRKEAAERRKLYVKRFMRRGPVLAVSIIVLALVVYLTGWHLIPLIRYNSACKALENQEYEKAYNTFVALDDYKDCSDKAVETLYAEANYLMDEGEYASAADLFEELPGYEESDVLAVQCRNEADYLTAKSNLDSGDYLGAAKGFEALKDYSDAAELLKQANYLYADELFREGEFEDAYSYFIKAGKYEDADMRADEAQYQYATECLERGDYEAAVKAYEEVSGSYQGMEDQLKEAEYFYADQLFADGDYKNAVIYYSRSGDYKEDGDAKVNEAKYAYVKENESKVNRTTYTYLRDLKEIGYADAGSIYQELYAWKAKITINNNQTYSTNPASSLRLSDVVCCHVYLSGGPPGGSTTLRYAYQWPGGAMNTDSWDGRGSAGSTASFYTWRSLAASTGTFHVYVYDEDDNQIGEASVLITN